MKSTDISARPPGLPGAPASLEWGQLATAWPGLEPALRRQLILAAGRMLHALWMGRQDLCALPPQAWRATWGGAQVRVSPRDMDRAGLAARMSGAQLLAVLAQWQLAAQGFASWHEQLRFLHAFFRFEMVDRHGLRHLAREIAAGARRQAAQHARALYHHHLQDVDRRERVHGRWIDPAESVDQVYAELARAEADPHCVVLKDSGPQRVSLASVAGRTVVVKRYRVEGVWKRLRNCLRPSRARRAWAAARTLRDLGVATPAPLGYLDVGGSRCPMVSYVITEYEPRATSLREWIRREYRRVPAEARSRWRRDFARFFLGLYHRGLYHADTKALNMLALPGDAQGLPRVSWIDVDGVQPGHVPTRYQVLRNLVQLNGSVRGWVPDEDRLAFLAEIAREYPWLRHASIVPRMRRWTEKRLRKEIRTRCGP